MITTELNGGKLSIDCIWRTQMGEDIPLSQMETEHVVNTIGFLERQQTQHEGQPLSIQALSRELVQRESRA